MAFVTTGLINGGLTTHYQIEYDDSLSQADGKDRANALIETCEADYNLMAGWFGGIALTVGIPITVRINPGGYASAKWGPPIDLVPGNGSNIGLVRYLLVSEVVEMFMMAQNQGWFGAGNEGSAGEGLSRFLAGQFLIANGLGVTEPGFQLANYWMESPREDYVNNVDVADHGLDAKTGCAILFIYYLFTQLGFGINQIVAAAASELSGVYKNLTGDAGDPFPFFKQLLDEAFPGTTAIPGSNPDNPWPLGRLSFWVDKSTFGKDEVNDMVTAPHTGVFPNAFWLVLEGFNQQILGSRTPSLSGPALGFTGISMPSDPAGTDYERPADQRAPQRVRFPFDIRFSSSSPSAFPATGAAPAQEELDGSIAILGKTFNAATMLEFVAGADPYFTNVDPAQNNVTWLSEDLRVFTATPSLNNTPVPGGPAFGADGIAEAYSYVQSLIAYLNANFSDPTQTDPFNPASNVIPGQTDAYTGDSSVTPSTISGGNAHANYNFALARVRLRGTSGAAGEAENVKVFFRLWGTQTADTDYDTGSTYPSHLDSRGLPDWPQPGPGGHTIPFFATGNSPNLREASNPEYGSGGVNNQTIAINTGDSRWAYFGCFLNVYDPSNQVGGSPVQSLLTGTHHCLVAQIAYDDAPIVNSGGVTASPNNSDKLAQRNLQVTHSDNPGAPATHLIPQTFDVRPSIAPLSGQDVLLRYPDELMIDWGNTPSGSTASVYWPQVSASEVLQLAAQLYASHALSQLDAHTIRCKVSSGVTYLPIPPGSGESFAGLLTIDLPSTVTRGQEFNVIVRRVSTRRFREVPVEVPSIEAKPSTRRRKTKPDGEKLEATRSKGERNWRRVVGTFQVRIPVGTKDAILPAEEITLAIFKWRLQAMSPTNRWHPVLQRYVSYLAARVRGLGGDPDKVPASLTWTPIEEKPPHGELVEYTGKVLEVFYDCFGELEGLVLGTCSAKHPFKTREAAIGELALLACKERLLLTIFVERGCEHEIRRIAIRC
jgi:hypothetical protein